MDLDYFVERMSANAAVFSGLVSQVTEEQARWKPAPESWSMLEVLNHLYDEEREDFRHRLQLTLKDPATPWPPIAPQEWVTGRSYSTRDFGESLNQFLQEREKSLAWLRTLRSPAWESRHEREAGSMTAGDLMASWLAHDLLHIRQLTRLHWQYLNFVSMPFKTDYAGPWKEE